MVTSSMLDQTERERSAAHAANTLRLAEDNHDSYLRCMDSVRRTRWWEFGTRSQLRDQAAQHRTRMINWLTASANADGESLS